VDPIDLPALVFDVPYQNAAPLPALPVNQTRYCGLANVVYQEQGEPVVASP
jgi:hypothetical protein